MTVAPRSRYAGLPVSRDLDITLRFATSFLILAFIRKLHLHGHNLIGLPIDPFLGIRLVVAFELAGVDSPLGMAALLALLRDHGRLEAAALLNENHAEHYDHGECGDDHEQGDDGGHGRVGAVALESAYFL